MIAQFQITMKRANRYDRPEIEHTGITITEDTRAERDRAFEAVRKMFPDAREIRLEAVAPEPKR